MGTRVPVQSYGLRPPPANTFVVEGSVHDLNTVNGPSGEIEGIDEVDREEVTGDGSLENCDGTASVECLQESYANSVPLGIPEEHSGVDVCSDISSSHYSVLTVDDVAPIETARARFLEIIVNNFIGKHIIQKDNCTVVADSLGHETNKRNQTVICYEGDPRLALPLMYVANLYETLVNEVNTRLASLGGFREKTIGVALEAAGGLYRRLAKLFPMKGAYMFKRRELATSLETRTRFPELVVQEEKRVRFVVINGLEIIEKPNNMATVDAEWFMRLTGRAEVSVSAKDYRFYCPRHKYRRAPSSSASNIPGLPAYASTDGSSVLAASGFNPITELQNPQDQCSSKHHIQPLPQQAESQSYVHANNSLACQCPHTTHFPHLHQSQYTTHTLHEVSDTNEPAMVPQQMTCMQSLNSGHVGHLHILPTGPAKYCDQCGAPFLRETSKFCSECGVKRLGV